MLLVPDLIMAKKAPPSTQPRLPDAAVIPSRLDNMKDPPLYRGLIDACVAGTVRGWCISTTNPTKPVSVDVFTDGQKIGSFKTGLDRPDIEAHVGLPMRAGFEYSLYDNSSSQTRQRLTDLNRDDRTLKGLIAFRISQTDLHLDFSTDFEWSELVKSAPEVSTIITNGSLSYETTTPSLECLNKAPLYRGTIDQNKDAVISGWCVYAKHPTKPVELEMYLGDLLLASTTTSDLRTDISELLKTPTMTGFRFSSESCLSKNLEAALKLLGSVVDTRLIAQELVSVRVKDTHLLLPFGDDAKPSEYDFKKLHGSLSRKLQEVSNNTRSKRRDKLFIPLKSERLANDEDVKIIAFYLPQYHPIPENDDWWGEGFSEWTNVVNAIPLFKGHDQPRIPADLGYYDLRLDATHRKQIDLAKQYGISAFCYYYYWFSGTTLLTTPIDRHCDQDYPLDFCLCWANENWSRRWDGSENDILMSQQHTESDDGAFIHSVLQYFRNERYIKVDGAPLLIVYRISLLAKPLETIEAWRRVVRAAGFPDLHVCMAETFGLENPLGFGADSSCQFPPHGVVVAKAKNEEVDDLTPEFSGVIYDYIEVASNEIKRPDPGYLRYRTAMPSWDNTSRRGKSGNIFHRAAPEIFEAWLSVLCAKTRRDNPPGKRLVFINAWNEWSEGAYLEPDRRNGHRNLKAVKAALTVTNMLIGDTFLPADEGDSTNFRTEVRDLISTLVNANRQILRFVNDYSSWQHGGPSPLIKRPANIPRIAQETNDGRCNIEAVNGRRMQSAHVTVLSTQRISLKGWLRLPGVWLSENLPIFLHLIGGAEPPEGPEFIAAIYDREQRQDVASAFSDESGQWYGFLCLIDFQAVTPGTYKLQLLVGSPTNAYMASAVPTGSIFYVG